MRVLQINTSDIGGGAARAAQNLEAGLSARGHEVWTGVGFKRTSATNVFRVPGARVAPAYARILWKVHNFLSTQNTQHRIIRWMADLLRTKASGYSILSRLRGFDNYNNSQTREIVNLLPGTPDVIHCHNLHGGYFDLRALIELSQNFPVLLTLHDAWLLTGHCAHFRDCQRWMTGCGECPALDIYPDLLRDGTDKNWRLKEAIFQDSKLYVSTPSQWLMNKVHDSMLSAIDWRVIPNGVDTTVFAPGNKRRARKLLDLRQDVPTLLYIGSTSPTDSFKNFPLISSALSSQLDERKINLICIDRGNPLAEDKRITHIPRQDNKHKMSLYYQAADIYVHAAYAETFPYVILEAMACGTPVVATAVGGIVEQVREGQNGFLTPTGDIACFRDRVMTMLYDDELLNRMAFNAREHIVRNFSIDTQIEAYVDWYESITANKQVIDDQY